MRRYQKLRATSDGTSSSVMSFAINQLLVNQPRNDYKEFLELTVIYLGGTPPRGIRFKAPGAIHHARWMAKALYSLKIWMFRGQFRLTAREERGLCDICLFIVRVYVRAWFNAPLASHSPKNDLHFFQQLSSYDNTAITKVAGHKFAGHLWYLSEELIALAFFDDDLSADTKRAMVKSIKERDDIDNPAKRAQVDLRECQGMAIEDFVIKNTRTFFVRSGLPSEFLDYNPNLWSLRDDFQRCLQTDRSTD